MSRLNNQSYKIFSDSLTIEAKSLGAELTSICDRQSDWEFLWQADPAIWNRNAPVLFPIVGKLNGDQIKIGEQQYPMNQHGFARDAEFEVVEIYNDLVRFLLCSNSESLRVFPYEFKLFITYQVIGNTLETTYEIQNAGPIPMYFSIGCHPGFRLPEVGFNNLELGFESAETPKRYLLQKGLFTNQTKDMGENIRKLRLNPTLFEDDAIVWKHLNSNWIELRQAVGNYRIRLDFADFPYLGIWAKVNCGEFICLEPWHGLADLEGFMGDISEKEGIVQLSVAGTKSFKTRIAFSAP